MAKFLLIFYSNLSGTFQLLLLKTFFWHTDFLSRLCVYIYDDIIVSKQARNKKLMIVKDGMCFRRRQNVRLRCPMGERSRRLWKAFALQINVSLLLTETLHSPPSTRFKAQSLMFHLYAEFKQCRLHPPMSDITRIISLMMLTLALPWNISACSGLSNVALIRADFSVL